MFVDVALKIFNDGLVAETQSSTHDSDAFLEDVLISATKDFSLAYKPQMIRNRVYFSELYMESLRSLNGINTKISQFAAKLTGLVPNKVENLFECAAIGFWPTYATARSNIVIGPFRFERKLNTLPTENKYYSTAPMHTDDHIALLQEFESTFMS